MKSLPSLLLAAALGPLVLSGCSLLATHALERDVSQTLQPGRARSAVVAVLGKPATSTPIHPPQPAAPLPNVSAAQRKAMVALRDEYRISGLVLTPEDNVHRHPDLYLLGVLTTAGIGELISFPLTTADLASRSLHRHRLTIWYDARERLVTCDKE